MDRLTSLGYSWTASGGFVYRDDRPGGLGPIGHIQVDVARTEPRRFRAEVDASYIEELARDSWWEPWRYFASTEAAGYWMLAFAIEAEERRRTKLQMEVG